MFLVKKIFQRKFLKIYPMTSKPSDPFWEYERMWERKREHLWREHSEESCRLVNSLHHLHSVERASDGSIRPSEGVWCIPELWALQACHLPPARKFRGPGGWIPAPGADTLAFPEFFMAQDTRQFPVDRRWAADERGPAWVWPSRDPREGRQEAKSEARFLGLKAGGASGRLETKWLYQTRKLQEGGLQHLESHRLHKCAPGEKNQLYTERSKMGR